MYVLSIHVANFSLGSQKIKIKKGNTNARLRKKRGGDKVVCNVNKGKIKYVKKYSSFSPPKSILSILVKKKSG